MSTFLIWKEAYIKILYLLPQANVKLCAFSALCRSFLAKTKPGRGDTDRALSALLKKGGTKSIDLSLTDLSLRPKQHLDSSATLFLRADPFSPPIGPHRPAKAGEAYLALPVHPGMPPVPRLPWLRYADQGVCAPSARRTGIMRVEAVSQVSPKGGCGWWGKGD
jgi:hypothetical protein